MKSMVLRAGLFLVWLLANSPVVHAADTNPPPRLTVELRDGSRVVGDSVEKDFKFRSALLGEIKLPVKDIRSVEFAATNSAKLITVNGDSLTVTLVDLEIPVKTSFGKVELAADSIRKLSVAVNRAGTLSEGLVAWWPMGGDTQDRAGSNHGKLLRNGVANAMVVPHSDVLVSMQQTRQISFEAWIKPSSIPHEFPVILSKGGNQRPGAYGGYEFVLNANGDNDIGFVSGPFGIYTYGANGRWINNHVGEWICIAFVLDDKAKTASFYVNGKPTGDMRVDGIWPEINFDVPNALYIGAPDPASHPNRAWFEGEIRDVKLFNRVLSAGEIEADYLSGRSNQ